MLRTTPRLAAMRSPVLRIAAGIIAIAVVLAACGSDSSTATTTIALPQRVVLTRFGGDTESELLFALYSQALENAGLRVVRKEPVGDRAATYAALQNDTVQVVPDFSGELLDFLHATGATPATTTEPGSTTSVADTLGTVAGASIPEIPTTSTTTTVPLPVGPPRTLDEQAAVIKSLLLPSVTISSVATAEKKQVIACSKKAVDAHTLGTDTDLAIAAPELVIGGPAGFETGTPLGLAALTDTYHATFKQFVPLAPADVGKAVKDGTVDCIAVSSTDPVVGAESMTVLLDDKALVAPNGALALISAGAASPEVTTALDGVNTKLTPTAFAALIAQVVNDNKAPDYLASVFLQQK